MKTWQPISVHTQQAFLRILRNAGLTETLARGVIELPQAVMAERIISLLREESFEPTDAYKRARSIMGKNFLGIEEAMVHLGISIQRSERNALSNIPFTEATLRSVRDTHVLVALPPCSLFGIRDRAPHGLFITEKRAWYDRQSFATYVHEPSWCLLRKEPLSTVPNRTWDEQHSDFQEHEEVPVAYALVYATIAFFLTTGKRLFETVMVRTASVDYGGSRVIVGNFSERTGLHIDGCHDLHRTEDVGMAVCLRHEDLQRRNPDE